VKAKYQQVQRLAPEHSIRVLCDMLAVSRSGYHDWRGRGPSPRQQEDARLMRELKKAFIESRATYGRPRLTRHLQKLGQPHGQRRIGRLMRAAGLCARKRRGFRPRTTQSDHAGPIAPNHLAARTGPPRQPNEVWVVDITYIQTGEGWLFLAAVLDLYSRRVVGWAFHRSLATGLPVAALQMALQHRQPPRGLLHHSDRGCQYASLQYRALLAGHGLAASMSRTGNPYDNACMESFFSTLKTECLHHRQLATQAEAQAVTFDYIEVFYNRQRLHSVLDYQSPVDYENQIR
jgi:putative transposase